MIEDQVNLPQNRRFAETSSLQSKISGKLGMAPVKYCDPDSPTAVMLISFLHWTWLATHENRSGDLFKGPDFADVGKVIPVVYMAFVVEYGVERAEAGKSATTTTRIVN
jgi:hypothetical protein